MIWVFIPDPEPVFLPYPGSWIPDPWVKKAPDPGSKSATLENRLKATFASTSWRIFSFNGHWKNISG